MISCDDVIWVADDSSSVDEGRRGGGESRKLPVIKKSKRTSKNSDFSSDMTKNFIRDANSGKSITLKDLSEEDKQKIAQLIKELAKVGEEKEKVLNVLNNERREFICQVQQMEEEKAILANKQKMLADEVEQCQKMLHYYQNLISMQHNSLVAKETKDKTLSSKKARVSATFSDSSRSSTDDREHLVDEIRVREMNDNTEDTDVNDDRTSHLSSSQYKALLRKKKQELQHEQDSLKKLLLENDISLLQPESENHSHSFNGQIRNRNPRQRGLEFSTSRTHSHEFSTAIHPPDTDDERRTHSLHSTLKLEHSPHNLTPRRASSHFHNDEVKRGITEPLSLVESVQFFESSIGHSQSQHPTDSPALDDSQILQDIFFVA